MPPILLTRSKHIFAVAKFLQRHGERVEPLLRRADLPSDCLEHPESHIPSHAAFQFREIAARSTGLPNIALDVTRNLQIANLGDFGQLLLAAPTLAASLREFQRLMHTQTTTATIDLEQQGNGDLWFCHRLRLRRHMGRWHSDLYILQWMIKVVRHANADWSPAHIAVSSPTTPEREQAIESLGRGATSSFGEACTGFAIPQSMFALPMSKLPTPVGTSQPLEATSPADNLPDSLKQVLLAYRRDRWLSIEQAAEVAGMSVRTLQRRLADDQTSFSAVAEQARLEVAAKILESFDTRIADVAMELGYAEQGNFTRAFVRWSGVSPSQFRRQRKRT